MNRDMLIFSTPAYDPLRERMAAISGFAKGEVERKTFPDGERYRRILSDCTGRDVLLLGGTISDADTLEIYDLACALVHRGIHTLTIAIPYYGYQTMERAVRSGEVVVAKTRARLLSSIPTAGSGNRVVLLDLHGEGIAHYFSGSIQPLHVYAKPVILRLIQEFGGEDFVLGATDAGRAKWVESLANDLGVEAAFVFKRRVSGSETQVTALAADVRDRTVVVYDDMIRTGGSLIGAAEAYRSQGATRVAAVCTHGVFPEGASKLLGSGVFSAVACTDSHPNAHRAQQQDPALRVETIAGVLAEAVRRQP